MFGKSLNEIIINGKKYRCSGSNVAVINGTVYCDGEVVEDQLPRSVRVVVYGDVNHLQVSGGVDVNGNCGHVDCGGSCSIKGNVNGNVEAGGSVTCGNVSGDIDAGGSVRCKRF